MFAIMDTSARQNTPHECDPRQVRKLRRPALCDRYVLPYAETRHGVWAAQPQIKPRKISKKKRIIGLVRFHYFSEVAGQLMHLLPQKEDDEPPTILH